MRRFSTTMPQYFCLSLLILIIASVDLAQVHRVHSKVGLADGVGGVGQQLLNQFVDKGTKQVAKKLIMEGLKKVKVSPSAAPLVLLPALLVKETTGEKEMARSFQPIPPANPLAVAKNLKRRFPFDNNDDENQREPKRLRINANGKWTAGAGGGKDDNNGIRNNGIRAQSFTGANGNGTTNKNGKAMASSFSGLAGEFDKYFGTGFKRNLDNKGGGIGTAFEGYGLLRLART